MRDKLKLSAPWVTLYRELHAMFGEDPAVKIILDDDNYVIKLLVDGKDKAEAIAELLPPEQDFGNIVVKIEVVPANILQESKLETFRKAFAGNPALSFVHEVNARGLTMDYVVFRNRVVQYYNDDLGDIYGNNSTLYQDIAKRLFGDIDGIYYCTDTEKNLGTPPEK